MKDPTLSELAGELDRAAEQAAGEERPHAAVRLLRFAAELRRLQTFTGDCTMSAVADKIHEYKQALIAANARADAAQADAAKNAADVQRLNDLQSSGRILDDADVAALAEPVPGTAPTGATGTDAGNPAAPGATSAPEGTVVAPPPPDGSTAPQTAPADVPPAPPVA